MSQDPESEEDRQKRTDRELMAEVIGKLGDHFDSVQIFVTRHEPAVGGTIAFNDGSGHWHARFGQVREWVVKKEERMRMDEREDS